MYGGRCAMDQKGSNGQLVSTVYLVFSERLHTPRIPWVAPCDGDDNGAHDFRGK